VQNPPNSVVVDGSSLQPDITVELTIEQEDVADPVSQYCVKWVTVVDEHVLVVIVVEPSTSQPINGAQDVTGVAPAGAETDAVIAQRDAVAVLQSVGSSEKVGMWSGPIL
jgi:hypothetical protein